MSNPVTAVFPLASDLSGSTLSGTTSLSGVDPILYDDGLLLQAASENLFPNPYRVLNSGGWQSIVTGGAQSNTQVTDLPELAPYALRTEITSVGTYHALEAITATGLGHTGTAYPFVARISAMGTAGIEVRAFLLASYTDASQVNNETTMWGSSWATLSDTEATEWEIPVFTTDPAKTLNRLAARVRRRTSGASPAAAIGDWWACSVAMVEQSTGLSSMIPVIANDGSLLSGYSHSGTAWQSTELRAASSAAISPSGILTPDSGSLAFRLTRKIDTGDIEYILNCGTDGDDRLRIYIDTDDRLRVAWDTGGALPQSVVSSSTIAVGTEYLVYTEWDGINIAMSLDAGTLVTGIRDVPLGSWGTDDLVLGP